MTQISLSDLDSSLINDIAGETGYCAYEYDYEGATVASQRWHVAHSAADGRGGIVFVGSGSNGITHWTDAATPDEVLARLLADDMAN